MKRSRIKVWALASRPKTLWASCAPVLIGTALAAGAGKMHWPSAFIALLTALLIQIGTNYANDYFDFMHGADTEKRLGPVRATHAGLVKPAEMKRAFVIVYALAFAAGMYLVWRGGVPILTIGVLSIIFGIIYTGGPFPLGYYGLGDSAVLIFFGPVAVAGTYYVQALAVRPEVVLAGLSPGLFSVAILTVNNLRDIDTDRSSGKKTLAVRFGESVSRVQYFLSIVLACAVPVGLYVVSGEHVFSLLSTAVLLISIPSVTTVFTTRTNAENAGPVFNKVLSDTGKLLIVFSLLFSAGWLV